MAQEPSPTVENPMPVWLRDALLGAGLLGLVFLFYTPALRGGLLFDDDRHLTPEALWSLHGLWRIWFEVGASFQYYPVLHSAFWLEHRLWGENVYGYHLVNLLLHVSSAYLVVAVVRRLGLPGAWLAAYIFALHPVCVESVAWMSEQKNTLSTVFYLGSGLAYLHFAEKRKGSLYFLATGLFILALLSKTVAATLPGGILVALWLARVGKGWISLSKPLIPWFALGGAAGLFSGWMERKFYGAEDLAHFSLSFTERGMLACRDIWFYLSKLFWPSNLMFHYPLWNVSAAAGWQWLYVVATLALLAGLIVLARWHRGPLAGFLFFAGTLFPMLGFFNIGWFCFSYVADHFVYVASLGVIVPVAAGLTIAVRKIQDPAVRQFAPVAAGVLILALCSVTWHQTLKYRDIEALYQDTLARNPDSYMTHYNYGLVLLKVPGKLQDALGHFEDTVRLKTDDPGMYDRVGAIFLSMNRRLPEAIGYFEAALKLKPDDVQAHYYLGSALLKIPGRHAEAIPQFQEAVRLSPGFAEAQCNLGSALAEVPGRTDEAIAHFEAALDLKPNFVDAHYCLGNVLAKMPDQLPLAAAHFQAAIRLQPDFADAHYCLGTVLAQIPGDGMEAIAHLKEAIRLRPDFDLAKQKLEEVRRAVGK
ncbi:MAG: tetratricopeptide repeat protein [Chthoniobacteraceae bacterium]